MSSRVNHPVEPGGLSAADQARIFELAEKGWKSTRIAKDITKHPSTVQWFMYRNGLKAPEYRGVKTYVRNGREVRAFSPEEDVFIEALRVQEYGTKEIAALATKRFGHPRNFHTVACRLVMLAAREAAE